VEASPSPPFSDSINVIEVGEGRGKDEEHLNQRKRALVKMKKKKKKDTHNTQKGFTTKDQQADSKGAPQQLDLRKMNTHEKWGTDRIITNPDRTKEELLDYIEKQRQKKRYSRALEMVSPIGTHPKSSYHKNPGHFSKGKYSKTESLAVVMAVHKFLETQDSLKLEVEIGSGDHEKFSTGFSCFVAKHQ